MSANDPAFARLLDELFAAERRVRQLHGELSKGEGRTALDQLAAAVEQTKGLGEEEERALRFVRLATLLGEREGDRVVDLLVDILGAEEPEARRVAGETLL